MNNNPSRSPASPTGDRAADTHSRSAEATGSPVAPAPSGTDPVTIARGAAPGAGDAVPPLTDYHIVQKLGEGGMGAVYLAEDAKLGRKVALKTMRPELAADGANRDRFAREARAAANVESDYIVPIWHVGAADDGTPFIAMPFLKGEVLDSRMKREPVAPNGLIVKVAREVADGLAAAHAAGLIHRDIKPGNIWLEGDLSAEELGRQIKRCKILDFGLARTVDKDDANLTASGAILGTPAYMAPEQARGEKVDARADLFSLGVTLCRMATGQPPFNGATAMATQTPPPVLALRPDLPPALAQLIDQLMCKDASDRPQSAIEVVTRVKQIVKDIQAHRSGPTPLVQAPPLPSAVEVSGSAPRVPPVAPDEDTARHAREAAISDEPDEEPEEDEEPVAAPARSSSAPRTALLVATAVLGLGLLAWGAYTILFATSEGTLTVEIDDSTEARFKNGKLVLVGSDGKVRYTLSAERTKKIDAGTYTIRVEGADGLVVDTSEFALKKGDRVTVRVTLAPKPKAKKEAPNLEADRKAAEYALSIGGAVKVSDEDKSIKDRAELPKEPFRLTGVGLGSNAKVADAGLAVFRECRHVALLALPKTPVTDAGLKHFQNCANLSAIDLGDTLVTDAALEQLKALTKLTRLNLAKTQVTAKGLADLAKALPQCRIEWDGGVIEPKK